MGIASLSQDTPLTQALGRRARRKAELRARILRAALDLFARQGFFDTTIEQITEAADVGKGTFFNYFPTKEHVLGGFGQMQVAKVEAAVAEAHASQGPVKETLRRLTYSLAEEPGRSQALLRSLLLANLSSEPVRQLFRRNLARGRRRLTKLIDYGQRRGEIRKDIKAADMARIFQQTLFGAFLLWVIHPPSQLMGWLEPTFDLFWSGISSRRGAR